MEIKSEQKTEIAAITIAKILAVASITLAFAGLLCSLSATMLYFGLMYISWLIWFIAFLCGIISLIATKGIKRSWSKPVALVACIFSLYCTLAVTHMMSGMLMGDDDNCTAYLNMLSISIKAHCAKHDGEFPDPSKWCDLLLNEPLKKSDDEYDIYWKYFSEKSFRCPAVMEGRSSYAFNKNLAGKRISEVDPNVVVLFETTAVGWNQNGGPEIMCPDRHKAILGENGSYVLCPSKYDVRFVPLSEVKNLRWNP
jgi:hypothetical protein